jgi:hypothetical protein
MPSLTSPYRILKVLLRYSFNSPSHVEPGPPSYHPSLLDPSSPNVGGHMQLTETPKTLFPSRGTPEVISGCHQRTSLYPR